MSHGDSGEQRERSERVVVECEAVAVVVWIGLIGMGWVMHDELVRTGAQRTAVAKTG
jgi:hypothetical protein